MHSSVPSTASTASTAWSLTATLCPMSSRPISLAIFQPKSMSFCCQAVGPRPVSLALRRRAARGRNRSPAAKRMPSAANSSTIVPQQRVVAAVLPSREKMGQEHADGAQVGQVSQPPPPLEQPHLENLAHHRDFGHAVAAEVADGAAELWPARSSGNRRRSRPAPGRRARWCPGSRPRSLGGAGPRPRPAATAPSRP